MSSAGPHPKKSRAHVLGEVETIADIRRAVDTLAAAEIVAPSVSGRDVLDALHQRSKEKLDAIYGTIPDDVVKLLLEPRAATAEEMDRLTAWCALIGVEAVICRPEWVNWLDQNRETVLNASLDRDNRDLASASRQAANSGRKP